MTDEPKGPTPESGVVSSSDFPQISWSELDVLVIITVNDLTRHQFTSLDRSAANPLEDGIYIAGARKQDMVLEERKKLETNPAASIPAVCEILFGGFLSVDEATSVCDEIYEIRSILPEGQDTLGQAISLWFAKEQQEDDAAVNS